MSSSAERALPPLVRALASALDTGSDRRLPGRAGPGTRSAAVLVMISDSDRPDITFTERAHTLHHHPGQISLPGGAVDPGETAVHTALREAEEEIGLPPTSVDVLGTLPTAHVTVSRFDVTSVVGVWDGRWPIAAVGVHEVADVHRIAVDALVDPANRATATLGSGYRGPSFVLGEVFIWGFTAQVVDRVLDLAGWAVPWDRRRELAVPRRFHRDRAVG